LRGEPDQSGAGGVDCRGERAARKTQRGVKKMSAQELRDEISAALSCVSVGGLVGGKSAQKDSTKRPDIGVIIENYIVRKRGVGRESSITSLGEECLKKREIEKPCENSLEGQAGRLGGKDSRTPYRPTECVPVLRKRR